MIFVILGALTGGFIVLMSDPIPFPLRVLAVDDQEENLFLIQALLKNEDIHFDTVTSAQEAIHLAFETQYQMFILDISMPEVDGCYLASLLRSKPWTQNIPILVKTYLDQNDKRVLKMQELGNIEFIFGNMSKDNLLECMERLFEKQKSAN